MLRYPPEIDNFEPWTQRPTSYFLTTSIQILTPLAYFITTEEGVAPPPSIQS